MSHTAHVSIDGPPLEWPPARRVEVDEALARYPVKRSAILPVLWIAQREWGWLSPQAMALAARTVGLPEHVARIHASFDLAAARGDFAVVRQTVARLTGRPPTGVADFLHGSLSATAR